MGFPNSLYPAEGIGSLGLLEGVWIFASSEIVEVNCGGGGGGGGGGEINGLI